MNNDLINDNDADHLPDTTNSTQITPTQNSQITPERSPMGLVINPVSASPIVPDPIVAIGVDNNPSFHPDSAQNTTPVPPNPLQSLPPIKKNISKKTYILFAVIGLVIVIVVGIISVYALTRGNTSNDSDNSSTGWKSISAGSGITCGIYDGKAYCWGGNYHGALGDGTTNASTSPVAVTGELSDKTIKSIASGYGSCAISDDDNAYCWGDSNLTGIENKGVSVKINNTGVLAGKTIKSITVGTYFACAVASDDKAYCWGSNITGQLGNHSASDSTNPVAVDTSGVMRNKTIKYVSAGDLHACAVDSGNNIYCWGNNNNYQLGSGFKRNDSSIVPVLVNKPSELNGKNIKSLVSNSDENCILTDDGSSYCWGSVNSGLGNPRDVSVLTRSGNVGILANLTIKYIGMSDHHTCVIASDNNAYCWGEDSGSVLGNNGGSMNNGPVAVDTSGALKGKTIKSMSVSYGHTCVIASDDKVYCWGGDSYVPVAIKSPNNKSKQADQQDTTQTVSDQDIMDKSRALTITSSVINVAGIYNYDVGHFPSGVNDFKNAPNVTDGIAKVSEGIIIVSDPSMVNSSNGTTTVAWSCLSSCSNSKGGRIAYWDYVAHSLGYKYLGDADLSKTFVNPTN